MRTSACIITGQVFQNTVVERHRKIYQTKLESKREQGRTWAWGAEGNTAIMERVVLARSWKNETSLMGELTLVMSAWSLSQSWSGRWPWEKSLLAWGCNLVSMRWLFPLGASQGSVALLESKVTIGVEWLLEISGGPLDLNVSASL